MEETEKDQAWEQDLAIPSLLDPHNPPLHNLHQNPPLKSILCQNTDTCFKALLEDYKAKFMLLTIVEGFPTPFSIIAEAVSLKICWLTLKLIGEVHPPLFLACFVDSQLRPLPQL